MGIIDFPLTDGVHEENDNKLGKPSSLIACNNFYYELIGRLAVRGGFVGGNTDDITTATYGIPRHSVEVGEDLAVVTDLGIIRHQTAGANIYTFDHAPGAYLESTTPLPVASYTAGSSATAAGYGGAIQYVEAAGYEFLACGGILYNRPKGQGAWSRLLNAANLGTVSITALTTGSGAGIVALLPRNLASDAWYIYYQNTPTANGTTAAIPYGHDTCSVGNDAILATIDATNVNIYFVRGNTTTLKVTYAHGIGSGAYAGYVPSRIQIAATTTSVWVSYAMYNASYTWAIFGHKFTIPADPTSAWSSTPAVSGGGTLRTAQPLWSITNTGVTIEGWTDYTTAGGKSTYTIKWDMVANAEVAWRGSTNVAGTPARPAFVPCSRTFQPTGQTAWYVFAHASPWPEPGNAMYLVRWVPADNTTLGDGEVVSVTGVQATPSSVYGIPDLSGTDLHSPFKNADGSFVCGYNSKTNTGQQVPNLGTWRFCADTDSARRNIATDGGKVIVNGAPYEYENALDVPTICPITVWGLTAAAVAPGLDAGTHSVRYLVEVDTPSGVWQSAASLPQSITVAAGDAIRVNMTVSVNGWKASAIPWRIVAYCAPPGSTTYYRSATYEPENVGGAKILSFSFTAASALCQVITVDTAGEILYELAEPPHVYPGDAVGVAWANGRLWRWRGFSLWFTHSTVAGLATQWAGDDLRIDFNGDIQGVGQLQGQPVVITSDAVWLLGGNGPDRSGAGGYELRQLASVRLGCLDQRSVVETPAGLCWASVRGIEMVPAGGGIPVSVGQPVRETFASGTFTLGAHNQTRSLAIWVDDSGEQLAGPNVICFDYLRGVWFTWRCAWLGYSTMAGSWRNSFALNDYASGNSRTLFDTKAQGAGFGEYPLYSIDYRSGGAQSISAYLETGDVRVSGSQTNAVWRGVWLLGAVGRNPTPGDIVYTVTQTADGNVQAGQTLLQNGGAGEVGWFRSMALFPVSDADGVSAKVFISVVAEYGPGYAGNGGPPTISALSFDYDATSNLSRLGSANRS